MEGVYWDIASNRGMPKIIFQYNKTIYIVGFHNK